MSQYAILRLSKRTLGAAAAMARHALREHETPNADPARLSQNTIGGPKTAEGVMAAIRKLLPEKRRKDAVPVVELFIGASPEAMAKMDRKAQDSYFNNAIRWIAEKFGGRANIVSAVVHRDETTPHMQVLLVPLAAGKLQANRMIGGPAGLKALQDDFAERVGKPSGLVRGQRGSRAKHTSIKQFYGAIEAAGGRDALPARVPVPPALPEPGMLSSKAAKAEYAQREAERKAAMEANRKRQVEIERLAKVGLAAKGRPPRELGQVIAERDQAKADAAAARRIVAEQRRKFDELGAAAEAKRQEVQALAERAAALSKTVARMNERADAARPPAPSTRSREGR